MLLGYIQIITVLTETGAFGSGTGTSRTQVSSPVHKFQLQVCPVEIHIIIISLIIITVKRQNCSQIIKQYRTKCY